MSKAMIDFRRVSKFYTPDIVALKDISFSITDGEFLFMVGHSGAGKSTLIRLLIRQELPSEGEIVFDQIDVSKLSHEMLPAYRQQIGVVFQDYKLLETKTIMENLEFALEITGKDDKEVKETAEYLLEVVKLTDRLNLFPQQLSGGEKQRAGIARALANDPVLLIADEPTGNLDPETSVDIIEILQKINDWGTTVLIATHDKDIVDMLQKRVIRLEDGQVVSDQKGSYNETTKGSKPGKNKKNRKKAHIKKEGKLETEPAEHEKTDIKKLKLPRRLVKILEKNGINTIGSLLDLSESDLDNIKGIKHKNTELITKKLEDFITNAEKK